jgi:hypothetical protein
MIRFEPPANSPRLNVSAGVVAIPAAAQCMAQLTAHPRRVIVLAQEWHHWEDGLQHAVTNSRRRLPGRARVPATLRIRTVAFARRSARRPPAKLGSVIGLEMEPWYLSSRANSIVRRDPPERAGARPNTTVRPNPDVPHCAPEVIGARGHLVVVVGNRPVLTFRPLGTSRHAGWNGRWRTRLPGRPRSARPR